MSVLVICKKKNVKTFLQYTVCITIQSIASKLPVKNIYKKERKKERSVQNVKIL